MKTRLLVLCGMIGMAALSRLLPHTPNFAPITAIALFGGAHFSDKRKAFLVPIAALFLGDLVLGFYRVMPVVYLTFAAIVGIGLWVGRQRSLSRVAGGALTSSVLFFAVTNLAVWAFDGIYPRTAAGLVACYTAAIPFFQTTFVGDLLWTTVLFGGFALAERWLPVLREPALAGAK